MRSEAHKSLALDETAPPLREVRGQICATCRTIYPAKGSPGVPDRCVRDGGILMDTREFADSGEDPMLGRRVAGRFTVVARLGGGSMGTVYRARQEAMGRDVALKILRHDRAFDSQAKARFEREARANSLLVSPYTVTVFDFGEADDGSLFLAMEMLEGDSLGQRLRRVGRLPVQHAVRIAREALTSLGEAHEKGIIHRDIKPDNIFLAHLHGRSGPSETTKVLDFGIAKVMRGEQAVDALETQAGTVFGTPRYMSPEQAQGKPLDARSDLYSLGVILYQMIAGRPPFEDEDAVVVMARHIKSPPPSLSTTAPDVAVPPALEKVILRALAKDPRDRPGSAEEMARQLEESVALWVPPDGTALEHALDAPTERVPALRFGPRWGLIGGVAGGVVLAAIAAVFVFTRSREAPGTTVPSVAAGSAVIATAVASAASAQVPAAPAPSAAPAPADSAISLDALPDLPSKKSKGDKGAKAAAPPPSPKATPGPTQAPAPPPPSPPSKPPSKYDRFE